MEGLRMRGDKSSEPEHCTWVHFSLSDTEKLLDTSDDNAVRLLLSEKLGLDVYPSKQRQILLDLFSYTWLFAKKENYSSAQLSTILTVVKRLHTKCTSTARENLEEVLAFFQELMVQHSVNRPPFSHSVFSPCQVKGITEFILSTYFKHYKLYKYAFTKKLHLNVTLTYPGDEESIEEEPDKEDTSDRAEAAAGVAEVTLDPVKVQLKEILSNKLTKVVERQQAAIKSQLLEQETTLLNRISALEILVDKKRTGLTDSTKKKSKS